MHEFTSCRNDKSQKDYALDYGMVDYNRYVFTFTFFFRFLKVSILNTKYFRTKKVMIGNLTYLPHWQNCAI